MDHHYELVPITDSKIIAELKNKTLQSFQLQEKEQKDLLITFLNDNKIQLQQGLSDIFSGLNNIAIAKTLEKGIKATTKYGDKFMVGLEKEKNSQGVITGVTNISKNKLFSSKEVPEAFTGGIKATNGGVGGGQVVLKETQVMTTMSKSAKVAKTVNASIQVASFVVGQYYMSEISDELITLSNSMASIKDMMKSDILASLQTISDDLQIIADHQEMLLKDETIRNNTLEKIDHLKSKTAKLSNQAHNRINTLLDTPLESIEKEMMRVKDLQEWQFVGCSSLNLLNIASELEYIFGLGHLSQNYTESLLTTHKTRFKKIKDRMKEYSEKVNQEFKLTERNPETRKMSKEGIITEVGITTTLPFGKKIEPIKLDKKLQAFASSLASSLDERLDYGLNFNLSDSKIQKELAEPIQKLVEERPRTSKIPLIQAAFDSETQILVDDQGKYYYLTETNKPHTT